MPLTVKWGKERLSLQPQDPASPLSDLRQTVAEWTHLPPDSFKLIHAGALMKDDSAPLSAYHIRPNSTIAVLASAVMEPSLHKSEQSTISNIHDQLNLLRSTLVPPLEVFKQEPQSDKEHARLSELLLQSLLRLDAVSTDPEWDHARKERKAGVKEVQSYLDQLDAAWRNRKK
ncbi:hypothetical protein K435DRAFT_653468 [Dendrothele bispora CBS 962.96]|uniref:BAG domain-containing protein n=1 Tax=Dendrothele bispora (strain CBS 962.96) TaxID=1314807 RepID=A0A4S8MI72_DENBC|nr:hypothetical protein K435DRAFT_653468 [Dendrothele bispora CBS 962.96]